jgi:hypothetical protein
MALGLPMALLYSSLASGGMGALGGWLGGQRDQPQTGYDIVEMPQYPWATGTQEKVNQYYMDMLNQIQQGQEPSWMSNYLNPMQQGMQQNLRQNVYGSAGRPGTLRDVMGMGSITGVGPKAAMSKGSQHIADYLTESDKIDQYINSLKYNSMSNMAMQVPQAASSMARGPETQIVNYMGGVGQGNQASTNYGQLSSSIPWENMFGGTQSSNTGYTPLTYENSVTSPSQYSYIPSMYNSNDYFNYSSFAPVPSY